MHSSKSASNGRANRFQQLVLAHYIPEAVLHKIESTAQYDPVREEWLVIRLNFAGNVLRARYPERYASTKEGAAALDSEIAPWPCCVFIFLPASATAGKGEF